MLKLIKDNLPLIPFIIVAGLLLFPVWSHIDQKQDLISLNRRVDTNSDDLEGLKLVAMGTNEPMVGASTLFAQNASVQLNLAFFGEIKPDGVTCSNGEILKKTGSDNWDCAADASGAVASNSLGFGSFHDPLLLDQYSSVSFSVSNWEFNLDSTGDFIISDNDVNWWIFHDDSGASNSRNFEVGGILKTSDIESDGTYITINSTGDSVYINDSSGRDIYVGGLLDVHANASVSMNLEITGTSGYLKIGENGVKITNDNDGALTFLGMGNGNDENFILNLDDTSNEVTITSTTGLERFFFSGIGVSTSLAFEAKGYASASFYQGLAFGSPNIDCNDATDKLLWSAGLFTCGTLSVADTSATGGTGIDINTNDFVFDATELEALTWGAGGNATNVWTHNLSAGDPTLTWTQSGATISLGFEAKTYASASEGYFTNVLKLPLSGTINAEGEVTWHAASDSLDIYDGSVTRVYRSKECKVAFIESPTAANNRWMDVGAFDDPFTLTEVYLVNASGSNAAKWNLYFGTPAIMRGATTSMTQVFSSHRVASASNNQIKYTSLTNSAIPDGNIMGVYIASPSATLEKFAFKYCGRNSH